jgi:hypothetical protein
MYVRLAAACSHVTGTSSTVGVSPPTPSPPTPTLPERLSPPLLVVAPVLELPPPPLWFVFEPSPPAEQPKHNPTMPIELTQARNRVESMTKVCFQNGNRRG